MVSNPITLGLTQDLFRLLKRLPHVKLNVEPIPGLTNSEHELLVVMRMNITEHKPMLSASEITNLLHITPAGGTHLFNPLIKAGYIRRTPDPKDRRIALISLTEKGIETTDTLLANRQKEISGLISYLGAQDSQTFIRLLSKVVDYLGHQPGSPKASEHDR